MASEHDGFRRAHPFGEVVASSDGDWAQGAWDTGLDAGSQPDAGVYVIDTGSLLQLERLIDRNGQSLPVGLDLNVFANWIGAAATFRLPFPSTYYNASIGIPMRV